MALAIQSAPGTTRRTSKARELSVAEYLSRQIDMSPKTQSEIAHEIGFNRPNMISMIKKGETKLPIAKVGLMARALNIDPLHLFRMVMNEYEPETWSMIEDTILHQPVVSDNELEIIRVIRKSSVVNPKPRNSEQRKKLVELVSTFSEENE